MYTISKWIYNPWGGFMKIKLCIAIALAGAIAIQGVNATESSITNFIPDQAMEIIKKEMEERILDRMREKIVEEGRELRKGKIVQTHSKSYLTWVESKTSQIVFGAVCVKVAIPEIDPFIGILAEKIVGTNEIEQLSLQQITDLVKWVKSTTNDIPANFSEPKGITYAAVGDKLSDILTQIKIDPSNVSDAVSQLEKTSV
jgi:hypothetical protein